MEITQVVSFWTNVSCHFITWLMVFVIWRYVKIKDDIESCNSVTDVMRSLESIPESDKLAVWAKEQVVKQQEEIEKNLMNAIIKQDAYAKVTKPAAPQRAKRKYVRTSGRKDAIK